MTKLSIKQIQIVQQEGIDSNICICYSISNFEKPKLANSLFDFGLLFVNKIKYFKFIPFCFDK